MALSPFIRKQTNKVGKRKGVSPKLLRSLIKVESGGNPNAVSPAGARGLTQFMPGTAPSYNVQYGSSKKAQKSQIKGAANYLKDLGIDKDPRKALASYNAGPGNYQAGLGYADTVLSGAGGSASVKPSKGKRGSRVVRGTKTVPPTREALIQARQAKLAFIQQADRTPEDFVNFLDTIKQLESPTEVPTSKVVKGKKGKGAKGKPVKGKVDIVALGKLAQEMGLHVGENSHFGGVGGGHVNGSYHYKDRAIDVSGDPQLMKRYANAVERRYGKRLAELFWNGNKPANIKNGKRVGPGFVSGHTDHVHVAI